LLSLTTIKAEYQTNTNQFLDVHEMISKSFFEMKQIIWYQRDRYS